MRTLIVFVATAVSVTGCNKHSLSTFRSSEGGFSVGMPVEPKAVPFTESGVSGILYTANLGGGVEYSVAFGDLPRVPFGQGIDASLDGACNGAAENVNGAVAERRAITLDGHWPGRDCKITTPKLEIRTRAFLVETRLLHATVGGPPGALSAADMTAFLDSFRVVKAADAK